MSLSVREHILSVGEHIQQLSAPTSPVARASFEGHLGDLKASTRRNRSFYQDVCVKGEERERARARAFDALRLAMWHAFERRFIDNQEVTEGR